MPARYGGDEFAVILPDTDTKAAMRAGERIVESLRAIGFESEGRGPVPIGVSVGIASVPSAGRTATQLIAAADEALYRVKAAGGQSVMAAPVLRLPGGEVDAA